MEKDRAVVFECLRCEARQKEQWDVKRTFHCKACGNVTYPLEGHLPKERVQKQCRYCKAVLRATNGKGLCASCDR